MAALLRTILCQREETCFRTKTMKRWFGSAPARRWDRCSGCSGSRSSVSKDLVAGRPAEARDAAGRGSGRIPRYDRTRRTDRQCLRASRRADDVRPQRGLRPALRLSRLEIRRDRRGDRILPAEPAQEPAQGQGQDHGLSLQGAQRHGLGLYGPGNSRLPPLPNVEWNMVPAENVHVSIRVQECNWLQALEGEIDSAHAPILHGRIDSKGRSTNGLPSATCGRPSNASGRISA